MYKMEVPEEIHKHNEDALLRQVQSEKMKCELYLKELCTIFSEQLEKLHVLCEYQNSQVDLYGHTSVEAAYARASVNAFVSAMECDTHLSVDFEYGLNNRHMISVIRLYYDGEFFGTGLHCRCGKCGRMVD